MRRLMVLLLALTFFCWMPPSAPAEDGDWLIVEEEEEEFSPNARHQAAVLTRRMTAQEKIYQLFMVAPEALTGEEYTLALGSGNVLNARPVGGVVLFGQNIASEAQLKRLTDDLQRQAAEGRHHPLLIAVSEEGGVYSRVANKLGYSMEDAPAAIGRAGSGDAARAAGERIAGYLREMGVNVDFAPVADVGSARSYGDSADTVSRLAVQMAVGLRSGGVTPCWLHFPGQGSLNRDPNVTSAVIQRTMKQMRTEDWLPFRAAIDDGAGMIMVSHGILRDAGDGVPASLSPRVIAGFLRGEMGYDGVVITDSLRMGAITGTYPAGTAAVRAIQAGADLLLLPSSLEEAAQGIAQALKTGEITEERLDESVTRILALKIEMGLIR